MVSPVAHVAAPAAEAADPHGLLIIGCGNPVREDDGVGCWVAQQLQQWLAEEPQASVRVLDAGTSGVEVMFAARGVQRLILIDACQGAGAAGEVFAVPGAELADSEPQAIGLHDFRWQHALHVGRQMFGDDFPGCVEVYLVEAETLDFGLQLSAAAERGARSVLARLQTRCREHTAAQVRA